jgi:FkbM family methyltransferase
MDTSTFAALRRDYEAGTLPRDAYWARAQELHRGLYGYFDLLRGGPVREIRIRDGELVVEVEGGLRMGWNPEDRRTVPNMLLLHGAYEASELAVLLAAAEGAEVVFDIGANVGWYTLHLARALGPAGRVYSFEPMPATFAALQRNVALNGLGERVTLNQLGLAEEAGEAEFYVPEETGSVAASRRPLFQEQRNQAVRATLDTLDGFVARAGIERLDLVKCDIEGGELPMLRGGRATLERFRPVVFLEMLRKWSRAFGYHPNDILDLMGGLGYRGYALGEGGLEAIERVDESCVHTNFLFLDDAVHGAARARVEAALVGSGE